MGLEDNLYERKRKLAKSNADLVAKIRRVITELSFDIAGLDESRLVPGLKSKVKQFF